MIRKLHPRYRLASNPFEPSATGTPLWGELRPPRELAENTGKLIDIYRSGTGVKAIMVVGEYGMGKTCLLEWMQKSVFPKLKISPYYFHNPGVHFYALANSLLNTIGRKNFAKFIWELAGSHITEPYQGSLFESGFDAYLSSVSLRSKQNREETTHAMQSAILAAGVTGNEQIAHCLARIAIEVPRKPYFEYRDFVPRQQGNVVAEGEEAPYFRAVLKTICEGTGADAIAFLVDEFEEISLQTRLTRNAALGYLATLKRLINLSQSEEVDFWVILSMTPDAYQMTKEREPSLVERFSDRVIEMKPLTEDEAREVMLSRLVSARSEIGDQTVSSLFPFPERIPFRLNTYTNPRRLVKVCFRALAQARNDLDLPFSEEYLRAIEKDLFPTTVDDDGS